MRPFIKWAGGKRWLAEKVARQFHPNHSGYYEPFLGGGAVFFHAQPNHAILSDANPELINAYCVVRDHAVELTELLTYHQSLHDDKHYYKVREEFYNNPIEQAARFLYLNRACWNGLYRVNAQGKFNVPRGTKNSIVIPGENLSEIALALENASITCCDFEDTIDKAGSGDFVYVDPPYTVKHNKNGFIKYNQSMFSWDDQVRLKKTCFRARERGATVLVSNADHASLRELYLDAEELLSVERSSVIAGKSAARQKTTELLAILRAER